MRHRSRCGVYRWPLRVQTINAESRPTKASRITSIRIINRSSFLLLVEARAYTRAFPFEAQMLRARTRSATFRERLMTSSAALPIFTHKSSTRSRRAMVMKTGPGPGQRSRATHVNWFALRRFGLILSRWQRGILPLKCHKSNQRRNQITE